MRDLHAVLSAATVDNAVYALRPDYRAMLIAVDGIEPGPSDEHSEALLTAAQDSARRWIDQAPVDQLPHIAAWRAAYRAFGAKPQRTRNSVEALTRRAADGLPRVNRLTDIYNAVSVLCQLPIGGEDLDSYSGAPHLVRATGDEPFDTVADGTDTLEHPDPGEVIWRDEIGVTCRRWNWRQCRRTQLNSGSRSVLFILDVLDPMTDDDLAAAAETLVAHVTRLGPQVRIAERLITPA
jgi:DNA/RNA-binding domain of Phe-tRNA-synthetase-like protein